MVRVQGHSLVPLPKGPCPSFRIAPCVGSLLWKAKLFGFLVYQDSGRLVHLEEVWGRGVLKNLKQNLKGKGKSLKSKVRLEME